MNRPALFLLTALSLVSATRGGAQTGAIGGVVTADSLGNRALPGAEVSIPALQVTTHANFVGEFRLAGIAPGRYLVIATAVGRRSAGDSVTIVAGETAYQDFVLATRAVTLDSVVTTAPSSARQYISPVLSGFEERRAQGFGHFITEAELRKNDGRFLPNVLEVVPGLKMVVYKAGTYIASSRDQKDSRVPSFQQFSAKADKSNPDAVLVPGCWVSVYTDGMRTYDPASGGNPPDFSRLDVNQFAGIEYYSGSATVPAQFNASGNTCGTLLLWTRER